MEDLFRDRFDILGVVIAMVLLAIVFGSVVVLVLVVLVLVEREYLVW